MAFLLIWTLSTGLATAAGFGVATGVLTTWPDEQPTLLYVTTAIIGGAMEGSALAAAQAWLMRRLALSIRPAAWVTATAISSALAWAVGAVAYVMVDGAGAGGGTPPAALLLLLGAGHGACLGIGQWLVLRGRLPWAASWIVAYAVSFALANVVAPSGLAGMARGDGVWAGAIHGAISRLPVGLAMGAGTGLALLGLMGPQRTH